MSSRVKRLMRMLGGTLAVVSTMPLFASPGSAVAAGRDTVPDWIVSLPLAQTPADAQKVIDYWKPERLKKASSYAPSRKASATPAPKTSTKAARPRPVATFQAFTRPAPGAGTDPRPRRG